MAGEPNPGRRWQNALKQIAMGLLMTVILVVLFTRIPFDEVLDALERVAIAPFATLVIASIVIALLSDSLGYWVATARVGGLSVELSLLGMARLRAASYVFSLLNYAAGQGSIIYLLNRNYRVAVSRAISAVLLVNASSVLVICLATGLGATAGAIPTDPTLRLIVWLMALGVPAYFAVLIANPRFLQGVRMIGPLLAVGAPGTLAVIATRVAHFAIQITAHYFVLLLFDIHPSFYDAVTRLPLLFLVAAVPITPAGLGTSQVAAVYLFAEFAPDATLEARQATVLAYSLAFQTVGMVVQTAISIPFARRFTVQPRAVPSAD